VYTKESRVFSREELLRANAVDVGCQDALVPVVRNQPAQVHLCQGSGSRVEGPGSRVEG